MAARVPDRRTRSGQPVATRSAGRPRSPFRVGAKTDMAPGAEWLHSSSASKAFPDAYPRPLRGQSPAASRAGAAARPPAAGADDVCHPLRGRGHHRPAARSPRARAARLPAISRRSHGHARHQRHPATAAAGCPEPRRPLAHAAQDANLRGCGPGRLARTPPLAARRACGPSPSRPGGQPRAKPCWTAGCNTPRCRRRGRCAGGSSAKRPSRCSPCTRFRPPPHPERVPGVCFSSRAASTCSKASARFTSANSIRSAPCACSTKTARASRSSALRTSRPSPAAAPWPRCSLPPPLPAWRVQLFSVDASLVDGIAREPDRVVLVVGRRHDRGDGRHRRRGGLGADAAHRPARTEQRRAGRRFPRDEDAAGLHAHVHRYPARAPLPGRPRAGGRIPRAHRRGERPARVSGGRLPDAHALGQQTRAAARECSANR